MPELPEVETIRRGLQPHLDGQIIKNITFNRDNLRTPITLGARQLIQGQTVSSLTRFGKYLFVNLSNAQTIVWHMGMSGTVRIYPQGPSEYEPKKHDHIVIETEAGATIAYNDPRRFGMFYIIPTDELSLHKPFSDMGDDALDYDTAILYEKLRLRKAPIKTVLLDQAVIAGLGNIYVCEALFKAGISPLKAANTMSRQKTKRLAEEIDKTLALAIENGGSTLKDHRLTDGSMGYFQHMFDVYGRAGETCPRCANDKKSINCIEQIKQAGRSTFYCPRTQKI